MWWTGGIGGGGGTEMNGAVDDATEDAEDDDTFFKSPRMSMSIPLISSKSFLRDCASGDCAGNGLCAACADDVLAWLSLGDAISTSGADDGT